MSYQIITDSCCDFTQEQYRQYRLLCANLSVVYDGESHDNFSQPDAVKAFYDRLRRGETATTSAVNPAQWAALMQPVLERGEDVLVIAFSSALSATCQSAVIAAEELAQQYPLRTVRVVDSLCAALGQGLLVHHACRLRDEGASLEQTVAWLEENKQKLCHWVTVDDLSHLKRGGRISTATAIVGTMLNIKPIIHVDEQGRLVNNAKARGRRAAIDYLAGKFAETATDRDTVFIAHGDCPEDAEALARALKAAGAKDIRTGYVGPVIGAHTGPGVLVVFFLGSCR